jgi:predicted Holliday junction resolvase-like endonuclease
LFFLFIYVIVLKINNIYLYIYKLKKKLLIKGNLEINQKQCREEAERRESLEERRIEKESEERRCRCVKKNREILYFSNDLWFWRVEK